MPLACKKPYKRNHYRVERVKILGNKFGLPIIYSQGNRFICLIIFKRMAQEVTARFPSL